MPYNSRGLVPFFQLLVSQCRTVLPPPAWKQVKADVEKPIQKIRTIHRSGQPSDRAASRWRWRGARHTKLTATVLLHTDSDQRWQLAGTIITKQSCQFNLEGGLLYCTCIIKQSPSKLYLFIECFALLIESFSFTFLGSSP